MMVVDGDKGKDKDRDVQYPIMGICAAPCGQMTKKTHALSFKDIVVDTEGHDSF